MHRTIVTRSFLVVACGCSALVACSSGPQGSGQGGTQTVKQGEDTGTVGLQIDVGPGITLSTVDYDLTGPSSFNQSGTIDVSNSPTIQAQIGAVPPASGYVITLNAVSTDGSTTCSGQSAPFTVLANQTTNESVTLLCTQTSAEAGTVFVGATPVGCASVSGISALPAAVYVGGQIQLSVAAHGPNPATFTYAWAVSPASAGTLTNATTATPTFTCKAVGTPTISVSVSDGSDAAGCVATDSVTVTCDALDAGH